MLQSQSEAACNQEHAGPEQALHDDAEPVAAQGEASVFQPPSLAALGRSGPLAQHWAVGLAASMDVHRHAEGAAQGVRNKRSKP